jgi:alkylation response protein AidB-like acyl-CoA dehydrogenase
VDLQPSVDQQDVTASVAQYLAKELSRADLHERLRTGAELPPGTWPRAAGLGLFSLGLPEEAGGAGCAVVEEALVARELGRQLAPVGFLGSVLGARVAHAAGDPAARDALAEGQARVAVALPALPGADPLEVLDLPGADWLLHTDDGGVALSPVSAAGAEQVESLDPSTRLSRVSSSAVGARLTPGAADQRELSLLGRLLVAGMLVGVAEAARDASVEYARTREQFGRPIGVYQAVKHPIADMATRCEAATSLLYFAALALRDGRPDADFQVASAKRVAGRAAVDNARVDVQVHGGMGFTWENDAHLFLTRAHLLGELFGDRHALRSAMLATAPAIP